MLEIYEQALITNHDDLELERKCADVAMEPGVRRYEVALRHLKSLSKPVQSDPGRTAQAAELEDLLGQCYQATSQAEEAEKSFTHSLELDPARVATYARLARLQRQTLKKPEDADRQIEAMVANNPGSALALVERYRYHRAFGPAADKADIARALALGPDEADVLIEAAGLAAANNDLATARKHVQRGIEKHPENPALYRMAAGFELADGHPDRAEALFRQGIAATTDNVDLKLLLVDTLFDQKKLEGDEGAIAWIDRLKKLGLADGYVQYLEGRAAVAKASWEQATARLEAARSLLASDPATLVRINLLLGESYDRLGETEKRAAAVHRAASGEAASPGTRLRYAQDLEREGRLDAAVSLHLELAPTRPESLLDVVRLLIRKNARASRGPAPLAGRRTAVQAGRAGAARRGRRPDNPAGRPHTPLRASPTRPPRTWSGPSRPTPRRSATGSPSPRS